jgi:hypothetical protein
VRHLGRDPRGDDRQKIEKLRASLAPLLVELSRLQGAAGIFQCAATVSREQPSRSMNQTSQLDHSKDPLAHWDILVQDLDDEPLPVPSASSVAARRTRSTGLDEAQPPVEDQVLFLPSNRNVTPCPDDIELIFRKNQANAHLHQLRELIAEKSFQYSDVL